MPPYSRGLWQEDEHQRFLEALKRYPRGPWAEIALIVGTRSPRQVQTHAQKYYEKIERHVRGLQRDRRGSVRTHDGSDRSVGRASSGSVSREHEIDQEILEACSRALELGERLPTPARPRKTEATQAAFTPRDQQNRQERGEKKSAEDDGVCDSRQDEDDDDEEEDEDEDESMGELLPLDKSLDFLIGLLAGLDESHTNTAFWTPNSSIAELQAAARFA
jgi:SHAQKYF class myb-like DNA-binding protein